MTNLSPPALALSRIHAGAGWEGLAKRVALIEDVQQLQAEVDRLQAELAGAIRPGPALAEGSPPNPHGMTVCSQCGTWRKSLCGEGCYWGIAGTGRGDFAAVDGVLANG
jgi:hypothetical protein